MAAFRCNKWFLCTILAAIFHFLKGLFFNRLHRRNKSDTDLPTITTNISTPAAADAPINDKNEDVADWDDWDYTGAPTEIIIEPTNSHQGQGVTLVGGASMGGVSRGGISVGMDMQQDNEDQPERDYFSDMTPTLKKTVLIRKKDRGQGGLPNSGISSRLAMNVDAAPVTSSELSTWDDHNDGTWEDEAGAIDISWDADRVIKEKKQADRDRRAAEQYRKRMERDVQRASKKDAGKLAVKLK